MSVVLFMPRAGQEGLVQWFTVGPMMLISVGETSSTALIHLPHAASKFDDHTLARIQAEFDSWPRVAVTTGEEHVLIAVSISGLGRENLERLCYLLEDVLLEEILELYAPPKVFDLLASELLGLFTTHLLPEQPVL